MDKQQKIVDMFDSIAPSYDKLNTILSLGIDSRWRSQACKLGYKHSPKNIDLIIDLACGTGEMCKHWAKNRDNVKKIIGLDPSEKMLDVARAKNIKKATFVVSQAKNIPCDKSQADIVSIAFGLRNILNKIEAIGEIKRVLKSGGIFIILEFMKTDKKRFTNFIKYMYMNKILPLVGGTISKNKDAYKYLPNSIETFIDKQNLQKELKTSGFDVILAREYFLGICTLLISRKRNI